MNYCAEKMKKKDIKRSSSRRVTKKCTGDIASTQHLYVLHVLICYFQKLVLHARRHERPIHAQCSLQAATQ